MKSNLMCFYFLVDEMKKLEKTIQNLKKKNCDLQVENFKYERKIKDLEKTLIRYKAITSNGYI